MQQALIRKSSLFKIVVDTTVMPKAIVHSYDDSRLLEKSRQHLVKLATEHRMQLCKNYNWQAPNMAAQIGHNAHAMQFKRIRKTLKVPRIRAHR